MRGSRAKKIRKARQELLDVSGETWESMAHTGRSGGSPMWLRARPPFRIRRRWWK